MRNGPGTDFGVDLSAYRRSQDRYVLPHALSIQVKGTYTVKWRDGNAVVSVAGSTLSSWLWSNTPTICVLHELSTGGTWWATPAAALPDRSRGEAKTRTLRIRRPLQSDSDWDAMASEVAEQWTMHEGLGALADLALVLQLLTHVALDTELWTEYGGHAEAPYHAATVHAYRTVCALNAIAGRTSHPSFAEYAKPTADHVGLVWARHGVFRGGELLGVVCGIENQPESAYLVEVLGRCGTELAATVPRLRQLANLSELGISQEVLDSLERISERQLQIIDPEQARHLTLADLPQPADLPTDRHPDVLDYDSSPLRPLGRRRLGVP